VKFIHDKVYGIDLDGVSVDFIGEFSSFLKKNLNLSYDDSEITDYYWHKCNLGISEVDFWRLFDIFGKDREEYRNLKPLPGAQNCIKFFLENAKDVWFITGRPHYAYEQTVDNLKHFFNVDSDRIIFSSGKDYKSNVVNRLGIDVFIDDAPHYAESIADNTLAKVYLMDTTYNRNVNEDKVTRVFNWRHIILEETKEEICKLEAKIQTLKMQSELEKLQSQLSLGQSSLN
jgi:uncharacterized HAD superfamily protein